MKLTNLFEARFCAHPHTQLTEASNLSRQELSALAGSFADENLFGVFKITDAENKLHYTAAYKDIALLFYYLQTPHSLPLCFQQTFDDDTNRTLAKLVTEEVLEVEWNGTFVSGMEAQKFLYKDVVLPSLPSSYLSHLSDKAIAYALQLKETDVAAIASRLYAYNTEPMILNETNALAKQNEVESFLGIDKDNALRHELFIHWNCHEPKRDYPWLAWSRRNPQHKPSRKEEIYKLYISPYFQSLPYVFAKAARVLTNTNAFSFKTGADRHGLLRPDKFVVYFSSHNDMLSAAEQLKEVLNDVKAQGVPFTAQLDSAGLISWGVDPVAALPSQRTSWRASVTERLAIAIQKTKAKKASKEEAINIIHQQMLLCEIDARNWQPLQKGQITLLKK